MKRAVYVVNLALVLASVGCRPDQFIMGKFAMGAARLTVRNSAQLLSMVHADDKCGFSSQAVLDARVDDGQVGDVGSATWTVEKCTLDFPDTTVTGTDCNGVKTKARGKATVSGTKTLRGILTGNPANPVVPLAPDAVSFSLEADLDAFQVESSDSKASMKMYDGHLSFIGQPHLALSDELGVCSLATNDVTLTGISYAGRVLLDDDGKKFTVFIDSSKYDAQVGSWGDHENWLSGTMTVMKVPVDLPTPDDKDGLDPAYNPDGWMSSYACQVGMHLPRTYDCPSLNGKLGEGAARLSVAAFGAIAGMLDADTRCGFASPAVAEHPALTGALGGKDGQAVFSITSPCTLKLDTLTAVSEDCNGIQTLARGQVSVTGTKTVRGVRTGDTATPIVPMNRDPAELRLTIVADNFTVTMTHAPAELTVVGGTLGGTLLPRLAKDTTTGACSIATPVAEMQGLSYQDAELLLKNDGNTFRLHVQGSALDAVNGSKGERTNYLAGTLNLGGTEVRVPVEGNALDPEYNAQTFTTSYACKPHMEVPASDEDCAMTATLADGSARLTIATLGAVATVTDADTACGFASPAVKDNPELHGVVGENGGEALWAITQPCTLRFEEPKVIDQDCNGVTTTVQGKIVVTGTKRLRGIRTGDNAEPIVPTSQDAVEITLHASFVDFKVVTSNSSNALTVLLGSLSGTLRPRLALDTSQGACAIATPVVEFAHVGHQDADLLLTSGSLNFQLHVASSTLDAQNGSKNGKTNYLSGTMVVDGKTLSIPTTGGPILNPDYNAATFQSSFTCKEHLAIPASEEECSFNRTLGEGVGRLMIQTIGTLADRANTNSDCGFAANWVLLNPTDVQGDAGEWGSMSWHVDDCQLGFDPVTMYQRDCRNGELWVGGSAVTDVSRTVVGEREKKFFVVDSIIPRTRNGVTITINNADLTNFAARYNTPATGQPLGVMTLHTGAISGVIHPYLGERASDPGVFDVSFPVVVGTSALTDVSLLNASVTLATEGKTFNVHVDEAVVSAFNGTYQGNSNWLSGHVTLSGHRVEFSNIALDPTFNQADFNAGYVCTPNLAGLLPYE